MPKKEAFLAAVAEIGTIKKAAEASGCDRHYHAKWLREDPEYRDRFIDAMDQAADRMEEEAIRRAVDGVRVYKFHNGKPIIDPRTGQQYFEDVRSDTLLMFLLNGARPEKYKYRQELTGPNGGPLQLAAMAVPTTIREILANPLLLEQEMNLDDKLLGDSANRPTRDCHAGPVGKTDNAEICLPAAHSAVPAGNIKTPDRSELQQDDY